MSRPFISVCIPAYNRAQYLVPLLNSILTQDFEDFEIIICEDKSPQRKEISQILKGFEQTKNMIHYFENAKNLGYDANFRELLTRSSGQYCFFMGNDDIMAEGALSKVAGVLKKNEDIGIILRSYDWFAENYKIPIQTVRYFANDRIFPAGAKTISTAFRRCGVLSGYVVHRETANKYSTDEFDGFLYYQMYLAASVLTEKRAYYIHQVLTHSRSTETPDFGNSNNENTVFTPGTYTPEARLHMILGMLTIARAVEKKSGINFAGDIERDIANYVYPYISDQLNLHPKKFYAFYKRMGDLGLKNYKMFHLHFLTSYIFKERGYNFITKRIRNFLGRTPKIGSVYEGDEVKI